MSSRELNAHHALVGGLLRALRPALAPEADLEVRRAAREVAQVLQLPGLDAALAECLRHAGPRPPREAAHVIARIDRLADAAEQAGSLAPFHDADGELGALAETLAGLEWTMPTDDQPASAAIPAADVLGELVPGSRRALERSRLAPIAAGALRAALDWLLAPGGEPELQVHDTSVVLVLPEVREDGLALAGATLAAAEGSVLQGEDGRWQLRVPLLVERDSFLLVRQGHLALALPWHAVVRLRMLAPAARAALREPVLSALAPAAELHGERPSALIARGLTRAWCVVERIVWRIVAEPGEPDRASPVPGLERAIEVEGGERYWVVEPAWLLRRVAPAETPASAWKPRDHALRDLSQPPAVDAAAFTPLAPAELSAPLPVDPGVTHALTRLTAAHAVPLVAPAAAAGPQPLEPPVFERPEPQAVTPFPGERAIGAVTTVLGPEHAVEAPAPADDALEAADGLEAPGSVAVARALVVDDSLVARLFLGRLLERRGFHVEHAVDAHEASALLSQGPWDVVFADLALPDLAPAAWCQRLLALQAAERTPFALVALTRDAADEHAATRAGLLMHLRKPFESESLDDVLRQIPRERRA